MSQLYHPALLVIDLQEDFLPPFPPEFTGVSKVDSVVNKGYLEDREYYSAFQDIWKLHKTELASLLKERGVTDVFVVGLALDFCVLNTAVDAVSFGFKTHLIKEGTKPVVPSVTDEIYEKLKNAGVEITDVKSLPPFSK